MATKHKRKQRFTAKDLGMTIAQLDANLGIKKPKRVPKYRDAMDYRLPGSFESGKRR